MLLTMNVDGNAFDKLLKENAVASCFKMLSTDFT